MTCRIATAVPDLPSAVPAVTEERRLPRSAHVLGGRPAFARQDRPDREVHRRQLHCGKKGGSVIGPTKRGKATQSWQSSTAAVFLSPCTWPVLHHMKFGSSTPRSRNGSSRPKWSMNVPKYIGTLRDTYTTLDGLPATDQPCHAPASAPGHVALWNSAALSGVIWRVPRGPVRWRDAGHLSTGRSTGISRISATK